MGLEIFRALSIAAMFGICLALILGLCEACSGANSLRNALPYAGLVLAGVWLARIRANRSVALLDFGLMIASVLGIWLAAMAITSPQRCWLCVGFWAFHYVLLAVLIKESSRRNRLIAIATVVSAVGLVAIRLDTIAWTHVLAAFYEPPSPARGNMKRPGQEIRPDIFAIDDPKTSLIVWTDCAPCQQLVTSGPLQKFIAENPKYRVWVVRGAEDSLPKELQDSGKWLIVIDWFIEDLGIDKTGPPIFVQLEGRTVKEIGWLQEYR